MSDEAFERKDFGAGSKTIKAATRQKISAIAKNALSLPVQCRFIARLATFSRARQILELGTSLGITAAYLQAGAPEAAIMTVEGDEMLADKARQTLAMLGAHNVTVFQQTFDDFLENHAFSAPPDLVFIDGNHRSEAVQAYLRKLLPSLSSKAIIIVDDIYWSQDMYEGWKSILQWPEIRQSIDCFRFGLLFVNPDFLDTAHHRIILPNW